MAHDERTAERIRDLLAGRDDVVEKTIVGGALGFMVAGNLCVAARPVGLTVRVGPDGMADALSSPHAAPLSFGRRTTKAFVVVQPEGYASDAQLRTWVDRGLAFVSTL